MPELSTLTMSALTSSWSSEAAVAMEAMPAVAAAVSRNVVVFIRVSPSENGA